MADQSLENILEVGCGPGKNTVFLSVIAKHLHALDFSKGMIDRARQKASSKNVEFSIADLARPWPVENECHDLIICNLVLEHVEDLSHIFSEAFRSLRDGGRLYISELHPFRQYQEGGKARFQIAGLVAEVSAYVHHVSDFLHAAHANNLSMERFDEYWHPEDDGKPPRLAVFQFKRA